jgi:hypothetical protein
MLEAAAASAGSRAGSRLDLDSTTEAPPRNVTAPARHIPEGSQGTMTNAEIVARINAAAERMARLEGVAHFARDRASDATLSASSEEQVKAELLLIDYDLDLTEKEVVCLAALYARDDDFRKP